MTKVAGTWRGTSSTIKSRQRKRLSRSTGDLRKPLYQAVFAPLPTSRGLRAAARHCIKDGIFIDPAMGTGNFFSVIPEEYNGAELHGVEIDSITGRIAKLLYPEANISVRGFETTDYEDNTFDVAVGNIPFNSIKVYDKRYEAKNFLIHDYFFGKSIDLVKPGGILAFITSKGTLDKFDDTLRKYVADRAELIGAIRLPNTAFKDIAGTEATSDILFFKKLEPGMSADDSRWIDSRWNNVASRADKIRIVINDYFAGNPDMILGEMRFSPNMYGRDDGTACVAREGQDLFAELDRAIGKLTAEFSALPDEPAVIDENEEILGRESVIKADAGTKNDTFVILIYNLSATRTTGNHSRSQARVRLRGQAA